MRMNDRPFFIAPALTMMLAASLALLSAPPARAADPFDADLGARGAFTTTGARVGDTIEYRLRVEWRDVPAAIAVLPPGEDLRTQGLTIIGQSAFHRKVASAGAVRNVSEFSYLMVAGEAGPGRVAPFLLRYRNGLANRTDDRVETVPVEGSTLEIGPARPSWMKPEGMRLWLSGAAAFAVLLALGLLGLRRMRSSAAAQRKHPSAQPVENAFTREAEELRRRSDTADSRLWLRDAEKLCVAYLCRHIGIGKAQDVRFEAALEQYLTRPHAPDENESWNKLRDLFHEARYAGGRKQPFELRDAARHLKVCLGSHPGLSQGVPMNSQDPASVKMEKR